MSKVIRFRGINIGGDATSFRVYHTSAIASNRIGVRDFTRSELLSGIDITVPDSATDGIIRASNPGCSTSLTFPFVVLTPSPVAPTPAPTTAPTPAPVTPQPVAPGVDPLPTPPPTNSPTPAPVTPPPTTAPTAPAGCTTWEINNWGLGDYVVWNYTDCSNNPATRALGEYSSDTICARNNTPVTNTAGAIGGNTQYPAQRITTNSCGTTVAPPPPAPVPVGGSTCVAGDLTVTRTNQRCDQLGTGGSNSLTGFIVTRSAPSGVTIGTTYIEPSNIRVGSPAFAIQTTNNINNDVNACFWNGNAATYVPFDPISRTVCCGRGYRVETDLQDRSHFSSLGFPDLTRPIDASEIRVTSFEVQGCNPGDTPPPTTPFTPLPPINIPPFTIAPFDFSF